ncbi:MAG: Tex-like N-terminal domain-containing protein [Pirellulaceae bacterium]
MDTTVSTDLGIVAREVNLPLEKVQRTIELLDDGNTVPFITRYRKDETGGLDEQQIRDIQSRVGKLRQLNERKRTILKSIQSQDKLTEQLAQQILKASTQKLLEDLYLPFKPKKQTLATQARERGLEPLADTIHLATESAGELADLAASFVDAEKSLADVDAVLQGVRFIIAERMSEHVSLRGKLRKFFWKTGTLTSTRIEGSADSGKPGDEADEHDDVAEAMEAPKTETPVAVAPASEEATEPTSPPVSGEVTETSAEPATASASIEPDTLSGEVEPTAEAPVTPAPSASDAVASPETPAAPAESPAAEPATPQPATKASGKKEAKKPTIQEIRREKRRRQKDKERAKKDKAFRDYYDYREPVSKIPPHRVLAINRGDRTRFLKVRIEVDLEKLNELAEQTVVPVEHPYADFLRTCLKDSLNRLVLSSIEREIRRELTDKAENHAIEVFAWNLRKLLLQPPVRGKRVLAIDPGFRSGCKLVALDPFGKVLGTGVVHLIGPEDRVKRSRGRIVEMIKQFNAQIVAIGNGTACRETENIVAEAIATELSDRDVCYLVVNEAGASVYSTSDIGREEFPKFDATIRGTVSIGRRLLDPLSELVKINPSNIGVGLYQHDVKAKHLQDSLDDVVESCVNYVGVDVNSASPALLSYVSGLNALTARRIFEYRQAKGPFRSREDLKSVPGVGEASFVQAAGFLKVSSGANPLDGTWIHPESYGVATRILEKLGASLSEIATQAPPAPAASTPAVSDPVAVPAATETAPVSEVEASPADATPESAEPPTPAEASTAAAIPRATTAETPSEESVTQDEATAQKEATAEGSAPEVASEDTPTEAPPTEAAPAEASVEQEGAEEAPLVDAASQAPATAPTPVLVKESEHKILVDKINQVDRKQLAEELGIGEHLAGDILNALSRPGRDPRADFPPPLFRTGILKLEDLEPGMELSGTVLNVVDFGAFVDIGLHDSGMVHISRLADRYVSDPHEVVSVGDVLKVWVIEIDKERRRVSLTAIDPAITRDKPRTEQAPRREKTDRPARQRRPAKAKQGQGQGQYAGGGKGKPKTGGRPPRQHQSKPKAAPAKPISEAMKEGKEPLRSFGDLQQFFESNKKDKKGGK